VVRRILLVEDSASTRSFVRAVLEDPSPEARALLGPLDIREAEGGFDAMRLLPRVRFDLIVTDINMPDVNGLELIRFVRQNAAYKTTPLLIISTQVAERDIERGRLLGADAYVPKPFDPVLLRETCARLLDRGNGPPPPEVPSDG
jgi:two-component system chemotaxis response regulator CheY